MKNDNNIGDYAFLIGIAIAVLEPLLNISKAVGEIQIYLVLAFLGVIVGLLKIHLKETKDFLIASIALVVAGTAGFNLLPIFGEQFIGPMLDNIGLFVAPASVIVAIKEIVYLGTHK